MSRSRNASKKNNIPNGADTPDWEKLPRSTLRHVVERWHSQSGFTASEMESLVGIEPCRKAKLTKLQMILELQRAFVNGLVADNKNRPKA